MSKRLNYLVPKSTGFSLTGNVNASGNTISNLSTPVNANDAATKSYADAAGTVVTNLSGISTADLNNVTTINFLSGTQTQKGNNIILNISLSIQCSTPGTAASFTFTLPSKTNGNTSAFQVYGNVNGYYDLTNFYTVWNGNVYGLVSTTRAKVSFTNNTSNALNYLILQVCYVV